MPIGAAVGLSAVGSIVGGVMQKKGADKAAKAQLQAADAEVEYLRESRDMQQRNLLPDRIMGEQAMFAIADMLGLSRPANSLVMQELAPEGFAGYSAASASQQQAPANPAYPAYPAYGYAGIYAHQPGGAAVGSYPTYGGYAQDKRVPPFFPYNNAPNGKNGLARFLPQNQTVTNSTSTPKTVGELVQLTPGLPSGSLAASPGYQFRFNEGLRAANTTAALSGMLQSGQHLKALQQYGQNIASDEFDKRLARLQSIAGIGTNATQATNNAVSSFGSSAGGARSSAIAGAGQSRASGYDALASGLTDATSTIAGHFTGKEKAE